MINFKCLSINTNVKLNFRKKKCKFHSTREKKTWVNRRNSGKKLTLIQMNIRFETMYVSIESKNDY